MKKQPMISGNIILKLDENSQSTQMTDEGCKLPKFFWNWNYYFLMKSTSRWSAD
jgi:hypothetical protein